MTLITPGAIIVANSKHCTPCLFSMDVSASFQNCIDPLEIPQGYENVQGKMVIWLISNIKHFLFTKTRNCVDITLGNTKVNNPAKNQTFRPAELF